MLRRHHCHPFLCKETFVTIAIVANNVGSQQQQWQWWGQATAVETEAAVGHTTINQQAAVTCQQKLLSRRRSWRGRQPWQWGAGGFITLMV